LGFLDARKKLKALAVTEERMRNGAPLKVVAVRSRAQGRLTQKTVNLLLTNGGDV